ncbi:hypothetical protein OH76DRAFT_1408920 [Lentinus brumalis]|uniref:HNH nuclease domain-containing protein n=1 Tax=Lentinus brumalis TaxID=2498619 RepID=A0A371CWL6_9APHY|nr:hypothetical protein OH76DRAFT_1408920 [Polyporus brumalis]
MTLREPLRRPAEREIRVHGYVLILHPGYFQEYVLLKLPAFDRGDISADQPQQGGVNLRLVLDACRIRTNNSEGFLSASRDGHTPLAVGADDKLLAASTYFYHITADPGPKNRYPVVSVFAAWTLPVPLPVHWQRNETFDAQSEIKARFARPPSVMSSSVKAFDLGCIVTQFATSMDNARYVPKEEHAWFDANNGSIYCLEPRSGINDTSNGGTLRSDVRACFDRGSFVFYPINASNRDYAAYSVSDADPDYTDLLHQRPVTMHERTSAVFLYARFAYNIILRAPSWMGEAVSVPAEITSTVPQKSSCTAAAAAQAAMKGPAQLPSTTASSGSAASYMEGFDEKKWEADWKRIYPNYTEEVEDPPDTWVQSHPDTVRIGRLAATYKAENPQVSMCSHGSTLHDCDDVVDGDYGCQ